VTIAARVMVCKAGVMREVVEDDIDRRICWRQQAARVESARVIRISQRQRHMARADARENKRENMLRYDVDAFMRARRHMRCCSAPCYYERYSAMAIDERYYRQSYGEKR